MEFTTRLELHSQTTRLVEGASHGARRRPDTGLSPSAVSCSKALGPTRPPRRPLQITTRKPKAPDFKFELLPLHSPLLGQSRLVSFPPLIDMLKFSGYPRLIRGQTFGVCVVTRLDRPTEMSYRAKMTCVLLRSWSGGGAHAFQTCPPRSARLPTEKDIVQHQATLGVCNGARTGVPPGIPRGAMCVQKLDDSLILQFALTFAFRCVLHRCQSQEIRC
jgi:hypothetical protein